MRHWNEWNWFNHRLLLEPIGNISPFDADAEVASFGGRETLAMAARLKPKMPRESRTGSDALLRDRSFMGQHACLTSHTLATLRVGLPIFFGNFISTGTALLGYVRRRTSTATPSTHSLSSQFHAP